jgi:hypothetical protein
VVGLVSQASSDLHGRLGKVLLVCSRAVVVAMANADGRRELLGLKVGNSESESFWSEVIADLKERGLTGMKVVVSDAHEGLTKAIRNKEKTGSATPSENPSSTATSPSPSGARSGAPTCWCG